jgi:hypothetical protein
MSETAAVGRHPAWRIRPDEETRAPAVRIDARRALQLALAGLWLLDGVLQYQPAMFTQAFPRMLAEGAAGNPAVIARPIIWDATLVGHHLVLLNTVFAAIQLLLGLGIAFRPTVRLALAASVAWALAVWWLGEGLGGVLSGAADPRDSGPGAVIIYALIAVLLWPAGRPFPAPFTAARAVGLRTARVLWVVFWLSQAYFVLTPQNRAPQAASALIAGMESGEPGWLAGLMRGAASLVAGQGLAVSIVLAAAFLLIAPGVFLPVRAARATLVLAIVFAATTWLFVQALGGLLASGATDPESGPLLALLALTYWPAASAGDADTPADAATAADADTHADAGTPGIGGPSFLAGPDPSDAAEGSAAR